MQKRGTTENRMLNLASQKLWMILGKRKMSLAWTEWNLMGRRPGKWVKVKFWDGGIWFPPNIPQITLWVHNFLKALVHIIAFSLSCITLTLLLILQSLYLFPVQNFVFHFLIWKTRWQFLSCVREVNIQGYTCLLHLPFLGSC